jgi:hypothetical protein
VHKGERYDFKTKKAWSSAAPNFGIPFGSKVLTVEIFLPNSMALPTQYRDGLTSPEDRSPLTAENFCHLARDLMPDWVKEVIKSESPEADEKMDDLQVDLQKLLDEFRVPTVTRSLSKKIEAERSEENEEGLNTTEEILIPGDGLPRDLLTEIKEEIDNSAKRAEKKKIRKAPEGAQPSTVSKALERVPEINILIDPEEILEKGIKGRAGRFYREAQTIFVNGLYPVVERMAEELERELVGDGEPEAIREIALKAARRYTAYRVGKAVCYAISKRLATEDWTMDDLERATAPESLSMAADDYRQSIPSAKKWSKDQLKALQIKEVA